MAKQMMKADKRAVEFIEGWEAYVGYVYDDKIAPRKIKGKLQYIEYTGGPVRGTLTIGIGHTKAAKCHVDMALGAKMTHEEARRVLDVDLDPVEEYINKVVKVPVTQGQFNALLSITYNFGEGNLSKSSILRKLNKGDYEGARAAFGLYTRSKGEVMRGLVRRRSAEQALWDEDHDMVAHLDPTKTEDAMKEVVPKADDKPEQTTSIVKSTEAMTAAGQVAAGTGSVVKEGIDATSASDHLDKVIDAKNKAEELGIEPMTIFGKVGPIAEYMIHQPLFWVGVVVAVFGCYQFWRRRQRLQQEGS